MHTRSCTHIYVLRSIFMHFHNMIFASWRTIIPGGQQTLQRHNREPFAPERLRTSVRKRINERFSDSRQMAELCSRDGELFLLHMRTARASRANGRVVTSDFAKSRNIRDNLSTYLPSVINELSSKERKKRINPKHQAFREEPSVLFRDVTFQRTGN